ncbi:amino acid ABC transporter permease [Pseudomonas matsuisoli]|uniref:Amino acid ABC transporter n=1 Tax=Pseudomonas matsuisoli TaxID=1515666 RepID=A0A917Q4J0_9PSED|nr:amino acid ABC transporter permease [Pseudomonas matsuisoli]GGK09048.1 amino acid ABC transporter [Pseudomonas matsuisoli]
MFDAISGFFLDLYEKTGLNFNIFYDEFEYDRVLAGAVTSLELMAWVICLSIVLGVIGASLQHMGSRTLKGLVEAYVQVFRNTPPMVQLLFFYFGLGSITPQVDMGGYNEPLISSFAWAVIGLSVFGAAYNVEIFRSGIESVPRSTLEASESLCLTKWQTNLHIVLPLAIRVSLPSLTANVISLAKTTSLVYVISVPEMTYVLNQIWSDSMNVPEMIFVLFLFYGIVIALIGAVFSLLERKLRIPGFGQ